MSVGHEYTRLGEAVGTLLNAPQAALAVGMSCAIGLGISFTGFGDCCPEAAGRASSLVFTT